MTLITLMLITATLATGFTATYAINEIEHYALECAEQEHFELCQLGAIVKQQFAEADRPFKCFARCFFERIHLMNSNNGTFNEDVYVMIFNKAKEEVVRKIFQICNKDAAMENVTVVTPRTGMEMSVKEKEVGFGLKDEQAKNHEVAATREPKLLSPSGGGTIACERAYKMITCSLDFSPVLLGSYSKPIKSGVTM